MFDKRLVFRDNKLNRFVLNDKQYLRKLIYIVYILLMLYNFN